VQGFQFRPLVGLDPGLTRLHLLAPLFELEAREILLFVLAWLFQGHVSLPRVGAWRPLSTADPG